MRKIKFRGKVKKGYKGAGEWKYFELKSFLDSGLLGDCSDALTLNHIDFETIGQYTGLKDCKGQEIYEGDIVREFNQNYNGKDFVLQDTETEYYYMVVKWEEGGFIAEGRGYETINLRYTDFDEVEVVGNIYENAELLKGEEK